MFEREFEDLPSGIRKPMQEQLEEAVRDLAQKLKFLKFGDKNQFDTLTLVQMCAKIALCLEFAERLKQVSKNDLPS